MRRRKKKSKRWIQKTKLKKGALHHQLGIPAGTKIPVSLLKVAAKMPGKLGKRARLALTLRKVSK